MSSSNRLPAVDGLRAVAACWVVLFHMTVLSGARFPQVPGFDLLARSGSTGVSLFLVLSGFCLFLPFAGGRTARFRSPDFFRRRFRRLAPAYYTSLALSLLLVVVSAGPLGLPQLTVEGGLFQILTHITLTHSLFPDTFFALNGAYWSLGLEWQLYLALPLLILGVRRFGLVPSIAFAIVCNVVYRLALGSAIDHHVLATGSPLVDAVLPNIVFGRWGEFALGMLAADLYASGRLVRLARYTPLLILAFLLLVPVALRVNSFDLSHMVYGVLFFTLICVALVSNNVVSRALSWRPLVAVGVMSYSLYLVHQPVIQTVVAGLSVWDSKMSSTNVFFLLVCAVPAIFFLAWLLFVTVERRTIGQSTTTPLTIPGWSFQFPRITAPVGPANRHSASTAQTD